MRNAHRDASRDQANRRADPRRLYPADGTLRSKTSCPRGGFIAPAFLDRRGRGSLGHGDQHALETLPISYVAKRFPMIG
jgi:hypothetical protein